jgi:oligoribonuclease (3'-5' exoribonuclease)
MNIIEKLTQITTIINEIGEEDPGLALILWEGYTLSLGIVQEINEGKITRESGSIIDVSEHMQVIARLLGFSLDDLIRNIMQNQSTEMNKNSKEADAATLEFITSDLDDYEKFIAKNSAKENLDFLAKEL